MIIHACHCMRAQEHTQESTHTTNLMLCSIGFFSL